MIPFLLFAAVACLGLAALLGLHRREWERYPHLRPGEVSEGPAWYSGRVVLAGRLESPILRRPAAYFSFRVEVFSYWTPVNISSPASDSFQWLLAHGDGKKEDFILEWEGRHVGVGVQQACFLFEPAFDARLKPGDKELAARLTAVGVKNPPDPASEQVRVEEEVLGAGDEVSVLAVPSGTGTLAARQVWSAVWRDAHLRIERRFRLALRWSAAALVAAACFWV